MAAKESNLVRIGREEEGSARDSVADNLHVSYRRRAQHFGVSGTTLGRILEEDLHLLPYKGQLRH